MDKKLKIIDADVYIGKSSTSDDSIVQDADGKTWLFTKRITSGRTKDLKTWEYRTFVVSARDDNMERGYNVVLRAIISKLEQYGNNLFDAPETDKEVTIEFKTLEG